jgi:hypothetical protein
MSRNRKAKRRLERSRKRGDLKERLKLNAKELALTLSQLEFAGVSYEDAMIDLWPNATKKERVALEEIYQRTAGCSLQAAYERSIIAALQKSATRRL